LFILAQWQRPGLVMYKIVSALKGQFIFVSTPADWVKMRCKRKTNNPSFPLSLKRGVCGGLPTEQNDRLFSKAPKGQGIPFWRRLKFKPL